MAFASSPSASVSVLNDESETGHGGGADVGDGGGHCEAVRFGVGRVGVVAVAVVVVVVVVAGGGGTSSSVGDRLGAGLVGVGTGVSGDGLTAVVGGKSVAALETDVRGGSDESFGRGGADVCGAADGVAVSVDSDVRSGRHDGGEDGDQGCL